MNCKYCGNTIDDNAAVCPICGCCVDKEDGYYFDVSDSADKWVINGGGNTDDAIYDTPFTEYPSMMAESENVPKTENLEAEAMQEKETKNAPEGFNAPQIPPQAYQVAGQAVSAEAIKRREVRAVRKERERMKQKVIIAGIAAIVLIAFFTFWLASGRKDDESADDLNADKNISSVANSSVANEAQSVPVVSMSDTNEFPGTVTITNVNGDKADGKDIDKSNLVRIINSQHYIRLRDFWSEYYMFDEVNDEGEKYGYYIFDPEDGNPEHVTLKTNIPDSDESVYRYIDLNDRKMYTDENHTKAVDLNGIYIVDDNEDKMIYVQVQQYCEADKEAALSFTYEADKTEIIIKHNQ